MKLTRVAPLICLAASLALFNGCLTGDDDGAGTGGTGAGDTGGFGENPELQTIEDDIASGVSGSAVSLSLEMLSSMVAWSQTPPGTFREASVTWNAEQSAWILTGDEIEEGEDVSATLQYTYWVQFRADGAPQQEANDFTDEIEIRADLDWSGSYVPVEADYAVDFSWLADYDVTGSRTEGGSTSLVGSGAIDGASTTTWQGGTYSHEQNVTWTHDLDMAPESDCASGVIEGSFAMYDFRAVLDGEGGVTTTLMRVGEVIDTDTDTYPCSSGAPGE